MKRLLSRASYQNASNPPSCSTSCRYTIFSVEPVSKNAGKFFGLRLVRRIFEETLTSRNPNQIVQHFGRFFHQIKVRQPIRSKDYVHTVCQRSRRLEAFSYLAAQNFELFLNNHSNPLPPPTPPPPPTFVSCYVQLYTHMATVIIVVFLRTPVMFTQRRLEHE